MREKKFSKSRVLALVLAFAMVVTAVPFAGFDAKAADDNNSVTVYRAYNTQTNDHLFTADENEYKTTIQNPIWNDEGRAWSAPKSSSTPIYRAYNTSNGEHLYTADAGEYNSLPGGWNKEGTLLYSDDAMGKPVYRLFCAEWDLHLYTADENEMATLLASGSWTADFDGAPAYYALADQSAEVSIIDVNGLQADGTALQTDTLQIVFGSNFGTPATVAWYRDGSVVKVKKENLETGDFKMHPVLDGTLGKLDKGEYYAVITNAAGESFTTNSITVGEAVEGTLSDVSYENNLAALQKYGADYKDKMLALYNTAPANTPAYVAVANAMGSMVEISKNPENLVVSATLDKDYTGGYFYLVSEDDTKMDATNLRQVVDLSKETSVANTPGGIYKIEKASKFTNEELWNQVYDTTAMNGTTKGAIGIYRVNEDKTVSYKINSDAFGVRIERGKDYYLIYSEDELKNGTEIENIPNVELATAPYVIAPDAIEVTDRQPDTNPGTVGWNAQLKLDAFGMDASWITSLWTPNAKITLYDNDTIKNTGGDEFSYATPQALGVTGKEIIGGQAFIAAKTASGNGQNKAVYAVFEASEGIFGEEALELTSVAAEMAEKPATKITVEESELDGDDAVVKFTGLGSKASGTAYIFQGNADNTTYDEIAKQDESKALGSVYVTGGTESATIEGVFKQSQLESTVASGTSFNVMFVPDDDDRYGKQAAEGMELTAKETFFDISGTSEGVKSDSQIKLVAYNQFGSKMTKSAINSGAMNLVGKSSASTDAQIKINCTNANPGIVTISDFNAGRFVAMTVGDKYEYYLNETQKLVYKVVADGTDPKFDVSIDLRV